VVVCDRRGEPKQGNKGDEGDADRLSELLRTNGLRAVYHGSAHRATLKELTRTYANLVEDSTRVMQRLKALFRARPIQAPGSRIYNPEHREQWLAKLPDPGVRYRARTLYAQLDVLRDLRPKAKAVMIAEAKKDPAWDVLSSIPYFGPVRVAMILAILQTLAIPRQASALGVRRPGGRHPRQRRVGTRAGAARSKATSTDDPRAEPQP
jgi:hypothetical protein